MSESTKAYYQNSELSLAAYATLDISLNADPTRYVSALKNAGMSEAQATRFANEYTIVRKHRVSS